MLLPYIPIKAALVNNQASLPQDYLLQVPVAGRQARDGLFHHDTRDQVLFEGLVIIFN